MSVLPLRPLARSGFGPLPPEGLDDARLPSAREAAQTLGVMLLRDGVVAPHDMVQALALHAKRRGRLTDVLLARGVVGEDALYAALARQWDVGLADLAATPPDARLIDQIGAPVCLRNGLVPWRRLGDATVVATAYPEDFQRHRQDLIATFGTIVMALAPARQIEAAVLAVRGPALARRAETRVALAESCRSYRSWGGRLVTVMAIVLAVLLVLAPGAVLVPLTAWALLTLIAASGLKLAALIASLRPPRPTPCPPPSSPACRSCR